MNNKFFIVIVFWMFSQTVLWGQHLDVQIQKDEKWWGGAIVDGYKMPFENGYSIDMRGNTKGNQAQPFLLSDQGRFIWCDDPFAFKFNNDIIELTGEKSVIVFDSAGTTLREGYLSASKTYFPAAGKIPGPLLLTHPQYNTWIELMYDQNQKDILNYAKSIINNGFPPGVIMIDDNWQEDYGTFEFKAETFQNPKAMIDTLHQAGFKVMLWICPFISADSPVYRELAKKRLLLMEQGSNRPAIIRWWNGASALLDLTNPETVKWFKGQLTRLVDFYNVDGFKLDAGDANYYTGDIRAFKDVDANTHSELFAAIGLDYPLNEYRACWKMGGQPLAQRLRDKDHSWEALHQLIPGIIVQGLVGYAYTCPDMIGGGEFSSFLNLEKIDQQLIVRSAQCHALMPMMQFSVSPWRVLSTEYTKICRDMALLHQKMGRKILALAKGAAQTGEPIVRSMEYVFPHKGYAQVQDQFMLGDDILVAPVLDKNAYSRTVMFPEGEWKGDDGSIVQGPCSIEIQAPIERLPWYTRVR
ncbi:glycoside hydrolase [candidate division KSB1 bacterium]|nr:glycoside hydrolase [candidate division KSB1 bacterium]